MIQIVAKRWLRVMHYWPQGRVERCEPGRLLAVIGGQPIAVNSAGPGRDADGELVMHSADGVIRSLTGPAAGFCIRSCGYAPVGRGVVCGSLAVVLPGSPVVRATSR